MWVNFQKSKNSRWTKVQRFYANWIQIWAFLTLKIWFWNFVECCNVSNASDLFCLIHSKECLVLNLGIFVSSDPPSVPRFFRKKLILVTISRRATSWGERRRSPQPILEGREKVPWFWKQMPCLRVFMG